MCIRNLFKKFDSKGIEESVYFLHSITQSVIAFEIGKKDGIPQVVERKYYSNGSKPGELHHGYSPERLLMTPYDVAHEGKGMPFPKIGQKRALNLIKKYYETENPLENLGD